jgi:hypothetical protein
MEIGAQNSAAINDGHIWDARLYIGKALSLDECKIICNLRGSDNIVHNLALKLSIIGSESISPVAEIDIAKKNNYSVSGTPVYVSKPVKVRQRRCA